MPLIYIVGSRHADVAADPSQESFRDPVWSRPAQRSRPLASRSLVSAKTNWPCTLLGIIVMLDCDYCEGVIAI
jgi:hypothetical protein